MIATQINAFADEIMLGALVAGSSVIVGIYGVGHQIVDYFQSLGNAFSGVLMPGLVRMVENKESNEAIQHEMTRIGRIIFMVLGLAWCGFFVIGKEFICLWAGDDYIDAYKVALILSFFYVFILTENVGSQILWAMNKHKEQSVLKFGIVLCNVLLTYFLIKWNPLLGATIGTAVALFLGDLVIMNIIFVKKIGFRAFKYYLDLFKGILPSLMVSIATGFLLKLIPITGWLKIMVVSLGMIIIYGLSMIVLGFNQSEKKMIKHMICAFSRKEE
jgi:O-antigen/teichoic acid export membrane protein